MGYFKIPVVIPGGRWFLRCNKRGQLCPEIIQYSGLSNNGVGSRRGGSGIIRGTENQRFNRPKTKNCITLYNF